MATPNYGDLIGGKGVYAGIYEVNGIKKEAYFEPDFLRDESGRQLLLNFNEAGEELAKRNGGRRYGNGSENAVRKAIASGEYKDGDLILAPREFLSGRDARGNMVRSGNLVGLLQAGKKSLQRIADTIRAIRSASNNGRWSISGTEDPGHPPLVYHTRLTDGDYGQFPKDVTRSGVVPLRLFSPSP